MHTTPPPPSSTWHVREMPKQTREDQGISRERASELRAAWKFARAIGSEVRIYDTTNCTTRELTDREKEACYGSKRSRSDGSNRSNISSSDRSKRNHRLGVAAEDLVQCGSISHEDFCGISHSHLRTEHDMSNNSMNEDMRIEGLGAPGGVAGGVHEQEQVSAQRYCELIRQHFGILPPRIVRSADDFVLRQATFAFPHIKRTSQPMALDSHRWTHPGVAIVPDRFTDTYYCVYFCHCHPMGLGVKTDLNFHRWFGYASGSNRIESANCLCISALKAVIEASGISILDIIDSTPQYEVPDSTCGE